MHRCQQYRDGFTLVELVTAIMLIAIISVVVLPRLLTSPSYSAYTLRDEFLSELRRAQLLAMNNQQRCYRVNVTSNGYRIQHFAGRTGNQCSGDLLLSEPIESFKTGSSLALVATGSDSFVVDFNFLGITNLGCSGACISVISSEVLTINIENQGYIYAS